MIRFSKTVVPAVLMGLLALASAPAAQPVADTVAMDWGQVEEYRIVPGDLLKINFGPLSNSLDLLREARVRPDGRISVYPIGDVVAAGRTPSELQASILQLLSGELRQPRITVEVAELAGNKIHVLGRVMEPGSYVAAPFSTLLQVLAQAGGFADDAARNSVLVFHRDGARTVRVARVKVNNLLKGEGDLPLSRFDIVYVPRSTIGNVDVFARQFFGEPTQMLQFAMTGWELFNLDRVFLVRSTAK